MERVGPCVGTRQPAASVVHVVKVGIAHYAISQRYVCPDGNARQGVAAAAGMGMGAAVPLITVNAATVLLSVRLLAIKPITRAVSSMLVAGAWV